MIDDDRAYFRQRADIETELAQKATVPSAAQAHRQLAQAYRGRLAADNPDRAEPS